MNFATGSRRFRRCSNTQNRTRDGGWALVSVLWTLTMLALMAAATQALTVTSYQSERHAMVDARAEADLDAAIVRAVLGIGDLRPEERWRADGIGRTIAYDGVALRISVQDELGRIDLNTASGSLIRQLLLGVGLSPDDSASCPIVSWTGATFRVPAA